MLVTAGGLRADLILVFDQHLLTTKPNNVQVMKGPAADTESTSTLAVELAKDWFSADDNRLVQQIDFKNRRWLILDKEEKTYSDSSLLAKIGFTSAEFKNRLMQAGMFEKMGLKDNPMDPVLMEHLFSLRKPDPVPLKDKNAGGKRSWEHAGKPLFSCSKDGFKLSKEETVLFVRFLRHQFGLHPDILDTLQGKGYVPNQIEIYRYNVGVEHYSLKLTKSERTSGLAMGDIKAGATENADGGLTEVLNVARAMDEAAYRARCEKLRSDGLVLREQGQIMDAFLLIMEYGLSCDHSTAVEMASMKNAFQGNADCMNLLASINPQTKEAAEEAVKQLGLLEEKAKAGRRMVSVFRANILTRLGQVREAQTIMFAALKENPAQSGAWKDLGDIYYNSYEMNEAWNCWEIARKHSAPPQMIEGIQDLEKHLIKTYPEFL